MEIDFSAEDGEPRYSFESCGADTDADGVVTFEVCGAPMIVRQGGELGERLWASGMALARATLRFATWAWAVCSSLRGCASRN